MTRFPLRRLRLRPGEQHREEVQLQLEPFELGGQRYLPVPDEVPAELVVSRASSGTVFELRFRARMHGPCMRCLDDAVLEVPINAREYQDAGESADDELRTQYIVENELDLSAWARDQIALALPEQILCRPDCAGLCSVCGKNLNLEPHEHEEEVSSDRWAALKELRDRL